MKILLVEDELKISSFIQQGLASEGYSVDCIADGREALSFALEQIHQLIIMDVMLPSLDGVAVCKKIREQHIQTPIIMVSARDAVDDRVAGLQAGADDYLVKPFSFAELLARVQALLRRSQQATQQIISVSDLHLNSETQEVWRKNIYFELSLTEFKLLAFLMKNTKKVLSRALILEQVWDYNFDPESNIVEVYVKYLRDKIDKGFSKKLIKTIRGRGYRLCE